jgi:2-C-methyl-D-erythritol 4-phosphate cytidylyltransferase
VKKYCIIVAGGSGRRMKSAIPKQFLLLEGRPLLMHTIERFSSFEPAMDKYWFCRRNIITSGRAFAGSTLSV